MSESVYKSHPIWSSIAQIEEMTSNSAFFEPAFSENEQYAFARDKIISVVKLIKANLELTPAVLSSIHGLNQLTAHLGNVVNEVAAFISNKNPAHVVNAANHIDQNVLSLLWAISPQLKELGSKAISEIFEGIRNASIKTIKNLKQEHDTLNEKISLLVKEIAAQQGNLNSLSETVVQQKAEAMAVTAQVQKEYAETEAKRITDFTKTIDGFKDTFKSYEAESKLAASSVIEKLEKSRDEASKIVQVVGNIGVTGNYQKIAISESGQANTWRNITVGMFCIGIIIALCTFWKFLELPFTPESAWSSLIRLLYAVVITTPAWYAAKESARHRSNADRARQTELELASLGPFIELMPEDKKTIIREELIKTYFGNKVDKHEVAAPIQIKDVTDLATTAIKALSK